MILLGFDSLCGCNKYWFHLALAPASLPVLARGSVPKQKNTLSFQQHLTFSPGAFYGAGGKTPTKMSKAGGRGGKAKSTAQPVEPVQPVQKDDPASGSEESLQVISLPSVISLHSPPAVPHLIYDNQPNRVGSKPSNDKPLGRFIPSPNRNFFNKQAQQELDELHSKQMMSHTTLVCCDVLKRQRQRLTPISFAEKAKLAHEIALRAVTSMGQTAEIQACFNDSFNRDDFICDLVEKAKDIK